VVGRGSISLSSDEGRGGSLGVAELPRRRERPYVTGIYHYAPRRSRSIAHRGIVFAYLSKIGRSELKPTVFWALGSAIAASVGGAILVARMQFNSDILEGWVMLAAAVFVISMIWFMHKTARTMKGSIEEKISQYTSPSGVSKLGIFFFVFLLVLREGVETVLILSAVTLNSTEILSFTGTLLGITVAVVFGVLFIRGSVKINLQRFFRVTTVILYFVAFQLIVSGLHELSENGVLPSSTTEMRLIGPIVRNDLFFFRHHARARRPDDAARIQNAAPHCSQRYRNPGRQAQGRVDTAPRKDVDDRCRRHQLPLIFLSTAEFIYAKSSTALSPTNPVTLVGSQVTLPTADVNDDQLHRYGVHIDDGKGGNVEVRFLLFKKPDGNIVSVADACQICGPVGFYIGSQGITCKMCASPLNACVDGAEGRVQPDSAQVGRGRRPGCHPGRDLRELAPVFER